MIKKKSNSQLRIGLILLVGLFCLMVIFSIFRGLNIKIDIEHRLETISFHFPLGTDDLGRDLLSSIIIGAWISLFIGLAVVVLSSLIGMLMGMIAGYAGGLIDTVIMRLVDIILAFPGILLAIALVSFFNQGIWNLIFALTFSGWVAYARLVRGEVLKYKNREFITAAKCYNASFFRIIFSHLIPLTLPLMVVQASLGISGVILAESSLNFLGIGLNPEIPTLGQLIDSGRGHIFDSPGLIVIPGAILFIIIISFNFIGEGLRKIFTK